MESKIYALNKHQINNYIFCSLSILGTSEKKGPKILDHCPIQDQKVPQTIFLSKPICKTLQNKDTETKVCLLFEKTLLKQANLHGPTAT